MLPGKKPLPVKLIIGLLADTPGRIAEVRHLLATLYGKEEEVLDPLPFTWTRYYAEEVGETPWRSFISYETLVHREAVVDIKLRAHALELSLCPQDRPGKRPVNIDPGYMTLGQFFLATTKDQRHRVYVRDGIFVEPTLYFEDGVWKNFEWTYRDYRSEEYHRYFERARSKLAYQLRHDLRPYSTRLAKAKDPAAGLSSEGGMAGEKGQGP